MSFIIFFYCYLKELHAALTQLHFSVNQKEKNLFFEKIHGFELKVYELNERKKFS